MNSDKARASLRTKPRGSASRQRAAALPSHKKEAIRPSQKPAVANLPSAGPKTRVKPPSSGGTALQINQPSSIYTKPSLPRPGQPPDPSAAGRAAPPLAVPHILFEGDEPDLAPSTDQKSAVLAESPGAGRGIEKPLSASSEERAMAPQTGEAVTPAAADAAGTAQPAGTGSLWLVAREPHSLYAGWDFSEAQQRHYRGLSASHQLVVRVYERAADGQPVAEAQVGAESRYSFISVKQAGTTYFAALGYYQADQRWVTLATSMPTRTPPDAPSARREVQFATLADQRRIVQPEPVRGEKVSAAKPSEAMRPGSEIPADRLRFVSAPPQWRVEEEGTLEEMIRQWTVGVPAPASQEIPELKGGQVSRSAAVPTGAPDSPVNISSPSGGGPESQRGHGFWLNVNAELVIYGATEPDARVTIAGRAIQLRPDGTFSYRFALPDGTYLLPVIAISKADDARQAELGFSRWTQFMGEVGAHPQEPGLKSPSAEGVA